MNVGRSGRLPTDLPMARSTPAQERRIFGIVKLSVGVSLKSLCCRRRKNSGLKPQVGDLLKQLEIEIYRARMPRTQWRRRQDLKDSK
jgi:hypothetical protein